MVFSQETKGEMNAEEISLLTDAPFVENVTRAQKFLTHPRARLAASQKPNASEKREESASVFTGRISHWRNKYRRDVKIANWAL